MCDPVTIAVAQFAIGAAGEFASYSADQQDYERQKAYRQQNTEATQEAAINSYSHQQLRIEQERDAAIQQKQEQSIEAAKARGTAITAAGEAGVSGLSVDALLHDYYAQEGRFDRAVDKNFQMNKNYLEAEMDATKADAQSRINSVPVPTKPNFASAAIRVAASGVNAASGYHQNTQVR